MGWDITAYEADDEPGNRDADAAYEERGQEFAYLRCSYRSTTVQELFRALKWRKPAIDGHGRWIAREQLKIGLQQFRTFQEREAQKPRNRRKDLTVYIRFLENYLHALPSEDKYLIVVAS